MIGLEIHCQLTGLESKLFCPCKADYRGLEPNSNICPVCAGLPGSLPRLNRGAVEGAVMIAAALNCAIPDRLAFFRKNYFYPDLPKNFQITQLDIYGPASVGHGGSMDVRDHTIRITRIQLEEDPGRLIYEGPEKSRTTLVDYNRAGTPLVEIVTEPDFENPGQVREFLNALSELLGNLGVSDPALEGAMRADGNVSVRGGPKVEIKNVGSFHDLEKAIRYETTRQESLHARGIDIARETRHWDERRKITVPARKKEEDLDYRYFLEADIPWVAVGRDVLDRIRGAMPESAASRRSRYENLGIAPQVAQVLSSDRYYSDLFDRSHTEANAKELANMITTDLMGLADTSEKRCGPGLTAEHLADLADSVVSGRMTRSSARSALRTAVETGRPLPDVLSEHGPDMPDRQELESVIAQVLADESDAVRQARDNPQAVNYLVGAVMKRTKGRADPKATLDIIRERLGS